MEGWAQGRASLRCTAQPSSPPPSPPSPPSPRSSPSPRSGPAPCVCDARDTARANTGICVCVIFLETVWPLTRHSLACGRSALRYVFLCVFDPAPPPPPISFPPYPVRLSVARVAPQLPVSLRRRPRCADKRRGIALFAPPEGSLRHPRGVHCLTTARNSWYVLASVYGGDDGCVGTEGGEVAVLLREQLGAVAAVD